MLSADDYRWLNTTFIVGEGEIDEDAEEWWMQAYVCVNEVVQHPSALVELPPARFRRTECQSIAGLLAVHRKS